MQTGKLSPLRINSLLTIHSTHNEAATERTMEVCFMTLEYEPFPPILAIILGSVSAI